MPRRVVAAVADDSGSVKRSDATAEDIAGYMDLSFAAMSGIDAAIFILNVRKVVPNTTADELRIIEFELGDQIAKKARLNAQMNAFMANQRAMKPPTDAMIADAKKLAHSLEQMIAANVTANLVIVTSTQLFKIWQKTEA